jgi:methyl-accepting chemotaxis protein
MEDMKTASNAAFKALLELQSALKLLVEDIRDNGDSYADAEEYQDALTDAMDQLESIRSINLFFLVARKYEKELIITKEEQFTALTRNTISNILEQASELAYSLDDDEAIDQVKTASQKITDYLGSFNTYATLMTEQQQLSAAMQLAANKAKQVCDATLSAITTSSAQNVSAANKSLIAIILVAIIFGILFALRIASSIAKPLKETVAMIDAIEHGHLTQRLKLDRQDEIGQLAASMDRFADSLQNEVVQPLPSLAAGNLTFEIKPHDDQDTLRHALKKLGDDLNDIMLEVQVAGEQIDSGSNQVSDSSQSLSQGAIEQASSLEEISSSLHDVADQTRQNASDADEASKMTTQMQIDAQQGNQQMQQLSSAMTDITESSHNISKIIKVIDEIAFQTNLLALNAAVEAARAGQHGKGFAVVAEEVRNLAARSAKAAQETTNLIEGSVTKANAGSQIAKSTASSLEKIVSGVAKASTLVAEIAKASNEQAQGIAQISMGVTQIDDITQQNTTVAQESAAASEELRSQADILQHLLRRFQLRHGSVAGNKTIQTSKQGSAATTHNQPKLSAAPSNIDSGDNWGGQSTNSTPSISLDDDDFGKF